ncbi:hypothetical protein [Microbacterium sp. 1P10AE]|uniref:hypothetical protein n=1 Tax=Microbacterium sp. 1P10AE TaxID=3132286 RepID=UPI00399F5C03
MTPALAAALARAEAADAAGAAPGIVPQRPARGSVSTTRGWLAHASARLGHSPLDDAPERGRQ